MMVPVWLFYLVVVQALLPSDLATRLDILAGDDGTIVAGMNSQQLAKISWAYSLEQVAKEQGMVLLRGENGISWLKPKKEKESEEDLEFLLSYLPSNLLGKGLPLGEFPQEVQNWVVERLAAEENPILQSTDILLEIGYAPYVEVRKGSEVIERVFLLPHLENSDNDTGFGAGGGGGYRLYLVTPLAEEGKVYETLVGPVVFFGRPPNLNDVSMYAAWLYTPLTREAIRSAAQKFQSAFWGISDSVKFTAADMSPAQREELFSQMEFEPLETYTYQFVPSFRVQVICPELQSIRSFFLP
ncbi:MAG: hypothetical protein AMXMBFR61_08450 [Fimbriimonadales bacterium]